VAVEGPFLIRAVDVCDANEGHVLGLAVARAFIQALDGPHFTVHEVAVSIASRLVVIAAVILVCEGDAAVHFGMPSAVLAHDINRRLIASWVLAC
jgi:hypothetical protein